MKNSTWGSHGQNVPPRTSAAVCMGAIDHDEHSRDGQLFFALNQISRAIFAGISFEAQEPREAVFFKKVRGKCKSGGNTANGIAGRFRRNPTIQELLIRAIS